MSPAARCKAKTKAGTRCRNKPTLGSEHCRRHSDQGNEEASSDQQGPNERALSKTLGALGREEDADAARFEMLRGLARAVDASPAKAALWAEYREALADMKKDMDDGDASLKEAIEALRSATEMVNPSK